MFGLRKKKQQPDMGHELKAMISEAEALFQKIEKGVPKVDRSNEVSIGLAKRDNFVQNINRSVKAQLSPELDLTPHCIFPAEVWTNPIYDEFLFQKMPSTPYDPWNTLLLASDVRTSMLLGLPEAPKEFASDDIIQAHMYVNNAQRQMAGSILAPLDYYNQATKYLYVYAMRMAAKKFGEHVVIKSRENFSQDPSVKLALQA